MKTEFTHMVYFQPPHIDAPWTPAKGTESKDFESALLKEHQLNKEHMGIGHYVVGRIEPGPIKLYHHKTGGGAEYLTDKFIVCPNGDKEGVFEGAEYIVRLDGRPELSIRNDHLKKAAPDLLKACQVFVSASNMDAHTLAMRMAEKAITKATE